MASRSGMMCEICGKQLQISDHIALNEKGDLVFLCNECYDTIKIFFK